MIQEADVQGISTRFVDDPLPGSGLPSNRERVVKATGLSGISRSQVSRLCEVEPLSAFGPGTMARAGQGEGLP